MPPRKPGYPGRVADASGQPTLPEILSAGGRSLGDLRSEAATCEACDLYKLGTQTVFGEGPEDADLMLMGGCLRSLKCLLKCLGSRVNTKVRG